MISVLQLLKRNFLLCCKLCKLDNIFAATTFYLQCSFIFSETLTNSTDLGTVQFTFTQGIRWSNHANSYELDATHSNRRQWAHFKKFTNAMSSAFSFSLNVPMPARCCNHNTPYISVVCQFFLMKRVIISVLQRQSQWAQKCIPQTHFSYDSISNHKRNAARYCNLRLTCTASRKFYRILISGKCSASSFSVLFECPTSEACNCFINDLDMHLKSRLQLHSLCSTRSFIHVGIWIWFDWFEP